MPKLALAFVVFLAGCAASVGEKVASFRPAGAPIWSSAAFDAGRIEGDWQQVATFSAGKGPGCRPGAAKVRRGATGMEISTRLCLNGREVQVSGPLRMAGPGRMAVPEMADWWVIWVDSGYRTLAVGTPDGTFGFVLDRGKISADRMTAATEIFDFNGYSTGRLRPF